MWLHMRMKQGAQASWNKMEGKSRDRLVGGYAGVVVVCIVENFPVADLWLCVFENFHVSDLWLQVEGVQVRCLGVCCLCILVLCFCDT